MPSRFVSLSRSRQKPPFLRTGKAACGLVALLAILLFASPWPLSPPPAAEAAERADITEITEAVERLPVVGAVLFAAAHPDDENSMLLPYLAKGLHLRTAYLSATRGDGGQNLLGKEQYEALGLLRTEELLAARRLDGAEQFFAQAYDFGFSKSAEETFQKWGHDAVLADFVRVIRAYRPDIVMVRFSGTSSDGHGHHQAAGILTREAFRTAADPNRFPEQLRQGLKPWQAAKLLWNAFRGGGASGSAADPMTLRLDGFNPVYGTSYAEIGQEARSMHRSQGMGRSRGRGATAAFQLEDSVPPSSGNTQGVFDGIDLTLNRFTALAGGSTSVARRVEAIQKAIESAREALSPTEPSRILPALGEGLRQLRDLRKEIQQSALPENSQDHALFLLNIKEQDFLRAIALAGGVEIEAEADQGEIVPGEAFQVTVSAVIHSTQYLRAGDVALSGPPGWKIERLAPRDNPTQSTDQAEATFRVTVPQDAPVSQPYWLVQPRTGDYFPAPEMPLVGAAQNPVILKGSFQFSLTADGKQLPLEQQEDVTYPFADRIYGAREKPLAVVPSLAVWLEPEVVVFSAGSSDPKMLLVRVRNHRRTPQQGTIRLELPVGWRSEPPSRAFSLKDSEDEVSVRFEVSPPRAPAPPQPEKHFIPAIAEVNVEMFSTGYEVVDYPHIQPRYWFRPATAEIVRFDVKVAPGLKVGYVMGSGDSVPEALKQLGVTVKQLGPEDLAFGDLAGFDAILTGIRAYEVRKDLSNNQARLMEYVRNGGVMIVQYSRAGGYSEPLGPYPMSLGSSPRVSVEEAPVEILEPSHPIFRSPNPITQKDFDGWLQERGTYFMESWDPAYTPLLSSHDPGEPPQKGGMLLASYGKGFYLYTGYVWFRQLPAGVPGTYRLFANLISLGKTPER